MPASTLTTKGQVTIPKPVRDALGVRAGDRISFVVRDDGIVELRPETVDLKDLFGILTHDGEPVTLEEMERQFILKVLEKTGWKIEGKSGAAETLDIKPNTLRSRMQKLGIRKNLTYYSSP